MKKYIFLVSALVLVIVGLVVSQGFKRFNVGLSGYEETPLALSTTGTGEFTARLSNDESSIDYELRGQHSTSTHTFRQCQPERRHFGVPLHESGELPRNSAMSGATCDDHRNNYGSERHRAGQSRHSCDSVRRISACDASSLDLRERPYDPPSNWRDT